MTRLLNYSRIRYARVFVKFYGIRVHQCSRLYFAGDVAINYLSNDF